VGYLEDGAMSAPVFGLGYLVCLGLMFFGVWLVLRR
jgi:hypothetical protein